MRVAWARFTTVACPVQIEGQLADGRWFYFRARYSHAGVGIGADLQRAAVDYDAHGFHQRRVTSEEYAERFDAGMLSRAQAVELLGELLAERLESAV